ncbi:hypothetical protein M132_0764 [Bacteroides fragilis str. S24L15]|uniref:Uncharacterized protein n=1 Tax=Bacteroides fragilis str. 3783N1-6 TaxID=1339310 RepID=A0AB73ART6_BACFG|nr:hypothetical protein M118_1859 [Bacteroides fragilis str. 3783N1-2]EXY52354.1 hypothetical protein M121_0828 [Bacteroides fragilis str. 3783N2-1]EXY55066.1 hypothetical protein M122_2726 [Bacteroides fragilis str. 3976T7]EXZ69480.1 hypothetical protein M120_1197 [Bacteroides fragilis str. 3783N1-8]EYA72575.1 hypothetical protein M132_0764 [Bacteroides fragilis str. S24L15]EYA77033.1 hypothetical protein M133_0818 [Bacteroides fragilis str. S24L26]EYB11462.1 hypothetical protein M119_0998 [
MLLPQTNVSKLTMEDKSSIPRSEGWKKTGKYRFERTLSII